jgi:hypothetical protein
MAVGKRTHIVMARFNSEELNRLDALRDLFAMSRAKYMRTRALSETLPQSTVVPELNRKAWVELSRSASNLNQIAHHLNIAELEDKKINLINISLISQALNDFRNKLIVASDSLGAVLTDEEGEE